MYKVCISGCSAIKWLSRTIALTHWLHETHATISHDHSCMVMALSQRFNTMQCCTLGDLAKASSTFSLRGTILPRRWPPSAVMISFDFGVIVAIRYRFCREAAEDHGVNRTNSGTRKHRNRRLGYHRHVNRHPIPGDDAELLQHVGELGRFVTQFRIGQGSSCRRVPLPRESRACPCGRRRHGDRDS